MNNRSFQSISINKDSTKEEVLKAIKKNNNSLSAAIIPFYLRRILQSILWHCY